MKRLSEREIIKIMNKKKKHFLSEDVEIFRLGNQQCAVCVDTLVESTDIPKGSKLEDVSRKSIISSLFLSGYHVGIENNIFSEFSGCSSININLIDKADIIKSLNNNLPSCKEVNFKIFGFSLATINLFISILISLYTVKLLINEKNRSN